MKKVLISLAAFMFTVTVAATSHAELGGQVFYKYGQATLRDDRGVGAYTDTLAGGGAGPKNDGDSGMSIAAGLDVPLTKLFGNTLLGEIMVEYSRFSDEKVVPVTTPIANEILNDPGVTATEGGPYAQNKVVVSELNVVVAPKYRFELGKVRPWIIPAGLAFMVNSPPSDDSTYLDIGYHCGVGVEYMLTDLLSLGVDYRATFAAQDPGIDATYSSYGAYVGINF